MNTAATAAFSHLGESHNSGLIRDITKHFTPWQVCWLSAVVARRAEWCFTVICSAKHRKNQPRQEANDGKRETHAFSIPPIPFHSCRGDCNSIFPPVEE